MHVLSVIAVFAISAGILLAAQSGCIGATLAGTDGSYNTPDTGLSGHALVQAVTAWEGMTNLSAACQIADTFADMFFTGVLDAAYAVHAVLSLTAVDNITDVDISLVLNGASDITTFKLGNHTYAAVAADVNSGVQILNITNPANITAAGNIADIGAMTADLELRGARGITIFESGGHTYAAVAADRSDGVQILNITDPLRITAAGSIKDNGTNTDDLELWGAYGITTFNASGHTYAAVTAYDDDGVQILNITDPSNITAAGNITNTDTLELDGASGIATFESGDHTYVAVAAYLDNGVQILDVTDPHNITPAGSITDDGTNTDNLELWGAYGITTFNASGHTYAAVAAYLDDGVQILNITDPLHITPAGSIDTNTLALNGAQDITTFTSGGHTYVAVAADRSNGVQILDVTDPLDIVPAGNIADIGNETDDLELYRPRGITTFTSGGHIYAAVAAYEDDGVQIIRIDIPESGTTSSADAFMTTWTVSAGQNITINFVGDDINIDWGDGATDTGVDGPKTHTYIDANDYTVSVTGNLTGLTLDRPDDFVGRLVPELASIDRWGDISWTNMSNAFAGASNMVYNAPDTPDLSDVTDMSHMFNNAIAFDGDISSWDVSSVTDMNDMFTGASSFNQTLNTWDVSSVTDMNDMFTGASSFNQPLNDWDVSSVINMNDMFFFASSFDGDISSWDISSVTVMSRMFTSASSFNQTLNTWDVSSVTDMNEIFIDAVSFNRPLNSWDVSSVTDMANMFNSASSFNQPLNDWDVSSVTNMDSMFVGAASFNQPLNAWDVSSVTDMRDMFAGATAFDQNLAGWYVVQDLPPVLTANATFSIRAQNSYLDDLVSAYSVDDTRFVMDDKTLSLNSTNLPPAGMYPLDITAPAVLGEPNAVVEGHTGTLIVTVKGEHRPFITTWRTTLQNQEITINFVGSGMNISWGDGMTETNVSGTQSHTYATASDYEVSVTGALTGLTLDRPDDFVGRLVPELASIDQWGGISWTNMSNAFAGASNMVYIATDTPDLSLVTDMSFMFESAIAFDGDLSSWDVSSVTDMSSMFAGATSFNQPLNTWDVSLVTEMNGMFSFATSFNQPLNDWDVSSVTYMVGMFFDADSFNQPLNDWDVSSVSTMNNMFFDADSFNQPLNDWDVSSVRIMKSMFHGATSFNQPLNTWDVSKVTNMGGMFFIATSFNQPLNAWDVSSVTDMRSMFKDATAFNQPLNDWDVSSVTNMDEMFAGATAFDQDLSSWYVAPDSAVLITDRSRTLTVMPLSPYIGEQSLVYTVSDTRFVMDGRTLSLSSTNPPTASIYDLDITVTAVLDEPNAGNHTRTVTITVRDTPITPFITKWRTDSANQTITIPVGGSTARYSIDWGDSPVETDITGNSTHTYRDAGIHTVYISGNFERIHLDGQQPNAGRLTSIEQWGDIYWTNMSNAFAGASNMTYSAMDTPDLGLVSDMSRMFAGATIFDGDISGWDVSTVRDMSGMFYSAAAFNGEISNWDVSAARNMNHMFARATSFNQPLNGWDVSSVSDMGGMFTGASSFNHDLNDWDVSAAIDMGGMFTGATLFNQDLSDWYLTLDGPAVIIPGYPRSPAVLPLSPYLDGRLHAYSVDDTRFVMDGRTILLAGPDKPPPTAGNYSLAINTAAVLGEPNTDSHTGNFEITIRAPVAEPFITVWRTSAPYQSVTIPGTGHGPVCNIDWGDGTTAIENDVACHRTHTYEFAGNYRVSVSGGLERIGIDGRQPYADRLISIVQWGDTYWTSMRDAFRGASNMGYPATDTPNLSRVTGMSGMFAETGAFNGDISDWDVSSVRDMNRMFSRANSFNQPLDGWDVSKVTDMGGMFEGTPFDLPLNDWGRLKRDHHEEHVLRCH